MRTVQERQESICVSEEGVLLRPWLSKPEILCFSEHWLQKDQILYENNEQYNPAEYFCREKGKHGGSCIFVSNVINVREVIFLKNLGRDKELEISTTELFDFKIIVIIIYKSPHGDVKISASLLILFNKLSWLLELSALILSSYKILIICCADFNSVVTTFK
jgi:hypothetical protein